ncbi:unnamed protein product [Allacma fusca]|uniref:Transmembrane protein 242 n=1 Tax=Allacma fusca TaxID=39272 RepID=A0A8J2LUU1_9HEXA|nr:unnamed protein product [Allacma fusca]
MSKEEEDNIPKDSGLKKRFEKWPEAVFLTGVAGASMIFGFGATIASAKKKDPEYFSKGMTPALRMETGGSLALRALGWGSFYAVTGCGILFYSIWKLMGVKNLEEFRLKVGNVLPRIPKNSPPQGRTEFENLTDLLQYIIDEDKKAKEKSTIESVATEGGEK